MLRARPVAFLAVTIAGCGGGRVPPPTAVAAPPVPAVADGLPRTAAPAASAVATSEPRPAPAPDGRAPRLARVLPLPGASGPLFVDYIAYERNPSRVWMPGGSPGGVAVLDVATGTITNVGGFETRSRNVRGTTRTVGPTAATIGRGFVYVGNRGTSDVCPVASATLEPAPCLHLPSPIDGVAYVAATREVWVTTPGSQAIAVLDASEPAALKAKAVIGTGGETEGYAVDEAGGRFFTNLEDKGTTLVIDVRSRKVVARWAAGCGADGPRGLAFDGPHGFVVVACTDHVQVLDAGHGGAPLGRFDTGPGLDNIEIVDGKVYAAAGKAARLTIASIDGAGGASVVTTADTAPGARNAVADSEGNAYVVDAKQGKVIVVPARAPTDARGPQQGVSPPPASAR